jgi:multidrug resistance efflux pump
MLRPGPNAWGQDKTPGPKPVTVFSTIEGRTTIVALKPDGSSVKQGDVVCVLDPAGLQDRMAVQKLMTRGAEAAAKGARMAREVAEQALADYRADGFRVELMTALQEIAETEAARRRAEERIAALQKLPSRDDNAERELHMAQVELQGKELGYDLALKKKALLTERTIDRKIRKLQAAIETARADELARAAALEREKVKATNLARQIEACRLVAPAGGRLSHDPALDAGVAVQEGQLLFRISAEGGPEAGAK